MARGYVSVPLSRVHTLKLTPSSPEKNGSLKDVHTPLPTTFLGLPFSAHKNWGGVSKNLRMRFGEGVFVGPMVASNHLGFFGCEKIVNAQGPLRWNLHLPKLPPLPGRNGPLIGKKLDFPQNGGEQIRHETDLKRMEILWKWILKKKRPPISWVQSFWGKKTSVYIGYRLGYRSARHISYNTLSKGPLSNLRLSMKSKVLFCVVRYANR